METDGLVVRTVYAEVPPRVECSLSELGETMRPIIKSMEIWGTIMMMSAAYTAPIFGWLSVSIFAQIAAILAQE